MPRWRYGLQGPWVLTCLVILLVAGLLAGCSGGNDLSFVTESQAVFLDNGQVFFGKLDALGSKYLALHDVYYSQRQVEPEKKEVRSLVARLGSEWHAPDFLRINNRHLVFIEPVAPESRLVQLIREAKAQPADAAPAATAPPAHQRPSSPAAEAFSWAAGAG